MTVHCLKQTHSLQNITVTKHDFICFMLFIRSMEIYIKFHIFYASVRMYENILYFHQI